MLKHQNLTLLLISIVSLGYSQTRSDINSPKRSLKDSVREKAIEFVANKLAISRPLNIEYTNVIPFKYSLRPENNNDPVDGKVTSFNQFMASSNISIITKQRWVLGATIDYRYYNIERNYNDPVTNSIIPEKKDFHTHTTSLNFSYFSSLFGKTVIYGSSVVTDGSEKRFERLRGIAYGTIVLKANSTTKITTGIMANIGPNNIIPVLPIFTYEQKLANDVILDAFLPKQVLLRKYIPKKARISVGAEMDQIGFFIYNQKGEPSTPTYEFQQTHMNLGGIYEHVFGDYFILAFRTGARVPLTGRFYEKSDVHNPIFKASSITSFYLNMGVSFNPFIKKGNK